MPGPIRGVFFYLYLILDIFSRKIVAWEVHARESAEHAADLVCKAVWAEGCLTRPLVLHADNGSPMKGATMKATLERLSVIASYSRPRVSDDNPFSEALFRTCKYMSMLIEISSEVLDENSPVVGAVTGLLEARPGAVLAACRGVGPVGAAA